MNTSRKFGWIPDIPDARDFPFKAMKVSAPAVLPKSVDLRAKFSPVEDQGQLGSCTANALAGALEFLDLADDGAFTDASRLYIYYNERVREGTVFTDAGAMIRDGVKVCADGYASERLWPYAPAKFSVKPPTAVFADAKKRKIAGYYRVSTLLEMKTALAAQIPVVFGFSVYIGFMSAAVAKTGIATMPKKGEAMEGGHAVCAAGYDDAKGAVLVRNSWGAGWGLKGYFWLPYGYIESRDLSDDIWAITKRAEG